MAGRDQERDAPPDAGLVARGDMGDPDRPFPQLAFDAVQIRVIADLECEMIESRIVGLTQDERMVIELVPRFEIHPVGVAADFLQPDVFGIVAQRRSHIHHAQLDLPDAHHTFDSHETSIT